MAEQLREDNMKVVKSVHYGVLALIAILITSFAVLFVLGQMPPKSKPIEHYITDTDQAPAKPLPDFIVDKLEPNELEQLKP